MITPETSIEKQIIFYESKIDYYLETIQVNEKGETCCLWIEWIMGWNNEIIELKNKLKEKHNDSLV